MLIQFLGGRRSIARSASIGIAGATIGMTTTRLFGRGSGLSCVRYLSARTDTTVTDEEADMATRQVVQGGMQEVCRIEARDLELEWISEACVGEDQRRRVGHREDRRLQ